MSEFEVVRFRYGLRTIKRPYRNEYQCNDMFIREVASGKLLGLAPLIKHVEASQYKAPFVLFRGTLYEATQYLISSYHASTTSEMLGILLSEPRPQNYMSHLEKLKPEYLDRIRQFQSSLYLFDFFGPIPHPSRSMLLSLVAQDVFGDEKLSKRHEFDEDEEAAFISELNAASSQLIQGISYEFQESRRVGSSFRLRQMRMFRDLATKSLDRGFAEVHPEHFSATPQQCRKPATPLLAAVY